MSAPWDELRAAYEGLEGSFPDRTARDDYRLAMLAKTEAQADFLQPLLAQASMLEVGCGNGRLLIELARRGCLLKGKGIDIAESRIAFAREWSADLGLASLQFEAEDALRVEWPFDVYDAIVCITGAFAYFETIEAGSARALLQRWLRTLRPGGLLVLELYPHPEVVRLLDVAGETIRLWQELPPDDPWRFYLSEIRLHDGILVHDKTFIHRVTGEIDSGRRERLRLYSAQELRELLTTVGLTEVALHHGWSSARYVGEEVMVVTARRAAQAPG